ncbi:MAG: pilus assembly protein [Enterovirga sp.]|jgi:Flp pilus assembly secretin CpaC|nr:pilus assembly protein [Enterovirga sp.]
MAAARILRWARGAAALAVVCGTAAPAFARDGVRPVPLAAVAAPPESHNLSDRRAGEPPRPAALPVTPDMSVMVDRAKIIRLPEKTQTVIIGNPSVADIAIQKSGVVVLTGKSFGVTNFIALDSSGSQIAESRVSVVAPTDMTLMVQRGLERQTYSCAPVCQPTVALGDAAGYFGEVKGMVDQHSAFSGQR